MVKLSEIRALIDAYIKTNGTQEITGHTMNVLLNEIVRILDERKQDVLVSGENIKTIGGISLLGEGDIPGYDDTEIRNLINAVVTAVEGQNGKIAEVAESVQEQGKKLTELSVETMTLQYPELVNVTHLFYRDGLFAGNLDTGRFFPNKNISGGGGKYCAVFKTKVGDIFEIVNLKGANSTKAWYKYNAKGRIISNADANVTINETLVMEHDGYIVFNHYGTPSDVFSVKTTAEIFPVNIEIGFENLKNDTEVITQNIQALEEDVRNRIDAIEDEVQSNSVSTQMFNLLNPQDVIDLQILDSTGGGIHSNNGYWTSGFIKVKQGVSYATNIKSIRRYALYDEDKAWISGGDNVNEIAASSNGFVRFSVEKSVDNRQPNELGFGVKGTDYNVEYGAFEVSIKGERLALYSDLPNIALEGKSIAIIGDSAVQASNWASNMGANLGFAKCDIYAAGGYTWRNNYQDGTLVNCIGVLLDRMIATNIKYDIILFQIGGSDITTWQPEVYGSIENALSEYNYKGYANATTTAECVRYYLSMIREMYPSSLILVGTPFQRMKSEGNAEDVAEILRKICAALCIQTIDGCKELGFSQLTECTTPYYNDGNLGVANNRVGLSRSNPIYNYIEDATGNIVDYTTATNDGILKSGYSKKYGIYTYDGKHQNAEGEKKVLEYMSAKLKTFVA